MNDLLTTEQAAERLGVSVRTLQLWVARGILPSITTTIRSGGGPVRLIRAEALATFERPKRGRPKYQASRGGHAPGYLREAFLEWLALDEATDQVEIDGEPRPLSWLLGQLWNCTDCLPAGDCQALDIPQGSTYAQAVRKVAQDLDAGDGGQGGR